MPQVVSRVIDVYPYRRTETDTVAFLLLRRAPEVVYAGQWRMVGGKIHAGEAAWQAAVRELREETGRAPVELWALPSVNTFYEWQHDRINLTPAFAARLDADPVLDREHDGFAWLDVEAAVRRLVWPEQQRLLRLAHVLLQHGLSPDLLIPRGGTE